MQKVKKQAEAFGARLRQLMVERGRVSPNAKSGVDVTQLAHAADTTYEMARRYAEGPAIPRPDKLEAIARWLEVPIALLAYGEEKSSAVVDERLLQRCIEAIQDAQTRTGNLLPPERAARLVARLYREAAENGLPAVESMDLLVKLSR
jgi:transcriptional regulator with XRE-family HTH domain